MQTEYKNYRQQGFCVRRAEVQNSTLVFQLNFSNKTSFCASKSRPNAKPRNVVCYLKKKNRVKMRKIKIRNIEDSNNYYLLNSRELNNEEIGKFLKNFIDDGEIVKIIDDGGVKGSANQFLVLKRDSNEKYLGIISFDNDNDFIYL